ncbi:MAG: hypothetical protein ACYCVB_06190 [Bacilli bacterium]
MSVVHMGSCSREHCRRLHSLQWLQLGGNNAVAPRFTAAAVPARIAIHGSFQLWRRSFHEIPGKK